MRNANADDASLAVRRVRGDGLGKRRPAGISVAKRDYIKTASGHSRQQNGGFVRFRAGVGEEALLQISWRNLCNLFRQSHDMLGGIERRSVLQPVDLRGHFAGNLRVAVAHGNSQDAAKEIEIFVALHVPQVLHLAAVSYQRLLEIIGHRRPQIFFVLGDGFFAARTARELRCLNKMCGCGHGGVLYVLSVRRGVKGRKARPVDEKSSSCLYQYLDLGLAGIVLYQIPD